MEKINLTREKIYEDLKKTALSNFNEKEINLILDYYLENKETKDIENLYKKVIKNCAKEFLEKLDNFDKKNKERQDITTLVSFLSLSPLNENRILEENLILKTIRAIPSITNIFLLYTIDSKKIFNQLKEYLEYKGIEVTGKEIDIDNINESYEYLQELAKAGEIDRESTILDSTSGFRMFGITLYKIAVERGINIVAWRDYQLPIYENEKKENEYIQKEKTKRIPFLTKLTLMQEPKFENAKIYRALVKELKNFNFSGAMSYYDTLGLRDLKKLCEDLDEVFNLKNILDLNEKKFYNSLENILKKILSYDVDEEKNKEIIRMVLLKLLSLIDYKTIISKVNAFNIKLEDIDNYIEILSKEDQTLKTKIYYSFVLRYLEAKLGEEAINTSIIQKINKEISKLNKQEIEYKNIDDILKTLFTIDNIQNIAYIKENKKMSEILEIKDKLDDIFEIADNLVDDVDVPIELNQNILKIIKYNLNIDLLSAEKKKLEKIKSKDTTQYIFTKDSSINGKIKYNSIALPIVKLLNGELYELDENILNNFYNCNKKTFSKNKSILKNTIIPFINEVVNEEIAKKGEKKKDLINKDKFPKIFINDFFNK